MTPWVNSFLFFACMGFSAVEAFTYNSAQINIATGYRQDRMNWIANLSDFKGRIEFEEDDLNRELIARQGWKQLQIYQVYADAHILFCDHIYVRGRADSGRILRGKHAIKYLLDLEDVRERARTRVFFDGIDLGRAAIEELLIFEAQGNANKGTVLDLSAGIGYKYTFAHGRVSITPIAGYSHNQQRVFMSTLNVFYSRFHPSDEGPVDDFRAHYFSRWYGPWIGADFFIDTCCNNFVITSSIEYHWIRFRGFGEQNLPRHRMPTYRQHIGGAGQIYQFGLSQVCEPWSWGLLGGIQHWYTRNGHMSLREDAPRLEVKLKETNWQTWNILFSLGYSF